MSNAQINDGKRILVVEDSAEMRSLLEDYLTAEGFSVHSFWSPSEALKALKPGGAFERSAVAGDWLAMDVLAIIWPA